MKSVRTSKSGRNVTYTTRLKPLTNQEKGKTMKMFKELTQEQTAEFKEWARQNYIPLTEIKGIWHPVIQAECALINDETYGRGKPNES